MTQIRHPHKKGLQVFWGDIMGTIPIGSPKAMRLKLPYFNQQDPWRDNKGRKGGSPPDLEAVFANLLKAKNKPAGPESSSGNSGAPQNPMMVFKLIATALLLIWFLSGIYVVKQAEQGVVLVCTPTCVRLAQACIGCGSTH